MRTRIYFLIFALGSGVVVGLPSPARAALNTWQVGVQVSAPDPFDMDLSVFHAKSGACYPSDAQARLVWDGDYVYVKDTCKDGRSALGRVTVLTGQDQGDIRVCRNKEGVGTWVKCNFNWPETPVKSFIAGVYNADTGYIDYGVGPDWVNG